MSNMNGRVIVITGAAQGLGLATALEAAKQGASLALVDLNADALKKAEATIHAAVPKANVLLLPSDVSKEDAVKKYIDDTVAKYGRIDGLYNNAGIEGRQAPLIDYDISMFKKVVDINLMGVYYGLRYVIPVMQKQKYGRIVNVASVGGIRAIRNQTAYVATKHAVTGITKSSALEYGEFGITTNAIAPGVIMTPMVEEAFRQVNPANPKLAEAESAKINPTKRFGQAEEVAKVVTFLLSEACSYVSGQTIAIDGGQSCFYPV